VNVWTLRRTLYRGARILGDGSSRFTIADGPFVHGLDRKWLGRLFARLLRKV
jgi:hypothetical protein